jgi:hypothetical protein
VISKTLQLPANRWRPARKRDGTGTPNYLWVLLLILALGLLLPPGIQAEPVGTFTQVVGQVDLLKPGANQVIPVKVQTGAEERDEISTQCLARGEIKFVDDTILTIAPESRIIIESYMFDAQKGQRQAIAKVTNGLVEGVVTKIMSPGESGIMLKTHTAIMGVRGTEFYLLLGPDFTDVLVKRGRVCAWNIDRDVKGEACVNALQASRIGAGLAPSAPAAFNADHLNLLKGLVNIGLPPKLPASSKPGDLLAKIQAIVPPSVCAPVGAKDKDKDKDTSDSSSTSSSTSTSTTTSEGSEASGTATGTATGTASSALSTSSSSVGGGRQAGDSSSSR